MAKNPPANAEDIRDAGSTPGSGRSPGGGKASHFSTLAWRTPWIEKPDWLQSIGLQRIRHNWVTNIHTTLFYPNACPCAPCTVRPNHSKTWGVGCLCLKKPKLPKNFHQSPFLGKVREGHDCYKPLAIRSFILEVRSWSGNQLLVPVWTRKSQVPSTAAALPGPSPDWEEEELSWQLPQGKVPRPCQLSPLRETGSQPNRPSDSSGSHIVEARSRRMHAYVYAVRWQRQGWGKSKHFRVWALVRGRPWWGLWSPAEHSPQPVSWAAPAHLLALGQVNQKDPRKNAGVRLLPHSPLEDHCSTDGWQNGLLTVAPRQVVARGRGYCSCNQWLSRTTNGCFLTVGCPWEGPWSSNQWLSRTTKSP